MSVCEWNRKEIAWMPEMHNGTRTQILVQERKRCSPWSKVVCGWTHELIQAGRTLQELSPIHTSGQKEWKSSGSTWVTHKNIDRQLTHMPQCTPRCLILNSIAKPCAMYQSPAHSDLQGPVACDLPYNWWSMERVTHCRNDVTASL